MTGSRMNQTDKQTETEAAQNANARPIAPGVSANSSSKPGDMLVSITAAVFAIPLLGMRELLGAVQDFHERIPSRRAAWLVKGIEIAGGLLLLLAGWILLQTMLYVGSHPVPTPPLPEARPDADAIRGAMFYMLAIGLLSPVTLFLAWAVWKFLFNVFDSILHRHVPRVFRPFAAPLVALALATGSWATRDLLSENFWTHYRNFNHNYEQATIDVNYRR